MLCRTCISPETVHDLRANTVSGPILSNWIEQINQHNIRELQVGQFFIPHGLIIQFQVFTPARHCLILHLTIPSIRRTAELPQNAHRSLRG